MLVRWVGGTRFITTAGYPTKVETVIQSLSLMQKITPFLWFDSEAEQAAKF
jgi:hypothetical protein